MNDSDNSALNITFLLRYLDNCRRGHFRLTEELRDKLKKFLCRGSYNLDGFSLHDVMRACVLYGLDALLRLDVDVAVREMVQLLKRTTLRRGRPYGSPNQR